MNQHKDARVLIVEDDGADRIALRQQLQVMGLAVDETHSHIEGMRLIETMLYHLVMLHSARSPYEVLEMCRVIKAHSTTPIIMITKRDEVVTEQMALHAGADDYIIKPINSRVLTARVSEQLRRMNIVPAETEVQTLVWQNFMLDVMQHEFRIGSTIVPLTSSEFRFMQLLMQRPQQVFSRDLIVQALGLTSGYGSDHIIDSHASRLRSKVRKNGGPEIVHAVRGVGFKLSQDSHSLLQGQKT